MQFVAADEPMRVPIPQNSGAVKVYVARSISELGDPQGVLLPETWVPPSKFWPLEDASLKQQQQQGSLCSEAPMAKLWEQEAAENKENNALLGLVNSNVQPLSKEVAELSLKSAYNSNRWWTLSRTPLTCPLTGFPIHLLPYPPFKLRVQAAQPWRHVFVDGKFLALHLIASDGLVQASRSMPEEVTALAQYVRRCKLGRFRLEVALDLTKKAASPELSQCDRANAGQELSNLRTAAEMELSKLQRIQEQRLSQVQAQLAPGMPPGKWNDVSCQFGRAQTVPEHLPFVCAL